MIVQPGAAIAQLGGLMKHLPGCRRRLANRRAAHSDTLREGRYESSPIATDADLLACCRDDELNPVRARMTETPASYPWSRSRRHAGEAVGFARLDEDPCCAAFGSTAEARATAYRALVRNGIPQGEWRLIREALQPDQPTGSARFTDQVEARVRRCSEHRGRGRRRKGRRADAGRKWCLPPLRLPSTTASSATTTPARRRGARARSWLRGVCA
jgi:putative transposase